VEQSGKEAFVIHRTVSWALQTEKGVDIVAKMGKSRKRKRRYTGQGNGKTVCSSPNAWIDTGEKGKVSNIDAAEEKGECLNG